MGDADPIRSLGDYSKPNHEGYRNTIELLKGNNVVPLRSDTIRLVQNGCSFHGLRSEDPNQHLKNFLKLMDSLELNGENKERTCLRLFQFSLRDQASNWLECLPSGSITTWEDLTTRSLAQLFLPGRSCEIDRTTGGKLRYKNTDESWEIIENLALYDYERWNDLKDFVKPVKAISTPQSTSKTPDQILLELEDQINFLLNVSPPTPRPSSTQVPQAYAEAVYSNPRLQNQNEPPKQNHFTFHERTGPNPQPQGLETTFDARVRDYMAAHPERMERFENAIFKQRELINDRMTDMFGLLKELSASQTLEKVLIREEARHPITKNINSISVILEEEEKGVVNNTAIIESIVEPRKSEEEEPPKKASMTNEVEIRANDEPTKIVRENVTKNVEEKAAGASSSHTV
ncbi:hypothetical protein Tco_1230777 [Tanacetum coccineum]